MSKCQTIKLDARSLGRLSRRGVECKYSMIRSSNSERGDALQSGGPWKPEIRAGGVE